MKLAVYYFSTKEGVWEKLKIQRLIGGMVYLKVKSFCYLSYVKENDTNIEIQNPNNQIPDSYALYQNFPNPFNSKTTIQYQIPMAELVKISIHDIIGREIRLLVHEVKQPGYYHAEWDGRDEEGTMMSSGMYLISLHSGDYVEFRKMYFIK